MIQHHCWESLEQITEPMAAPGQPRQTEVVLVPQLTQINVKQTSSHVCQATRCFWLHVNRWGRKYEAVPSSGISSRNSAGLISMATTTSVSVGIETSHVKTQATWMFILFLRGNVNSWCWRGSVQPRQDFRQASASSSENTNQMTRRKNYKNTSKTSIIHCNAWPIRANCGY